MRKKISMMITRRR